MKSAGRAYHWLSRSSLRLAIVLSLALHVLFGAWVVLHPARVLPVEPSRPGEIWFEEAAPPKSPEAEKKPERPPARTPPKLAGRERAQPAPDQGAEPPRAASAGSDAPRADAPRATSAPNLFPSQIALSEGGAVAVEPRRGETVHPDDPRFSPEVTLAQEETRVKARVESWAEDTLADARAQRGLPHPYLVRLRESGQKGLDKLATARGLRAPAALAARALGERYNDSAQSYGKSGDPNLGPPGQAPRLSERLTQPEMQAARALAQATETFNDLSHGRPLLSLTLELRQTKDNRTKTVVLKASIDPAFDAFVLEAWPLSIGAAGPPPADAFRASELRSIWEIEGWPGTTRLDKTMSYLPDPGIMGVPLTRVIAGALDGYGYEFRARLLRVY